ARQESPPWQDAPVPAGCEADTNAVAPDAGWQAACQLARASANKGFLDLEDARTHCQQAIVHARLQPEPYYLMATLCEAEGDDKAALAFFRKALYLNRGFTPAYLGLAAIHRRAGQADLAHREISRAYRLLDGRAPDEVVFAEEGLTVGRLRDALDKGLARGVKAAAG
ncbi:MAG TPA: hypothetical protein VMW62_14520, partial [Chloroflexota bacterium]|nr:hypothetical protein [Chloroflexota bacterium]